MLGSPLKLPDGLHIRPATPADAPFLESLFRTTRDDLQLLADDPDLLELLLRQQYRAQQLGHGQQFPNAHHFIIEKQQEAVGKVLVDFGHNAVHLVDLALLPSARGLGFGKGVLRALQAAAQRCALPMTLVVAHNNPLAQQLYLSLGFRLDASSATHDQLIWYPQSH